MKLYWYLLVSCLFLVCLISVSQNSNPFRNFQGLVGIEKGRDIEKKITFEYDLLKWTQKAMSENLWNFSEKEKNIEKFKSKFKGIDTKFVILNSLPDYSFYEKFVLNKK